MNERPFSAENATLSNSELLASADHALSAMEQRSFWFRTMEKYCTKAGVTLNGNHPWDIQINDCRTCRKAVLGGSLGLGEAYMDGLWDCEQLDELFHRLLRSAVERPVISRWTDAWETLHGFLINCQSRSRAFIVGEKHYDVGNELYKRMLDPYMTYTCAYWKDAETLQAAQEAKLDLVCRKIGLQSGNTVLDVGCGWGSFARFAAERYGAIVTGITISREQMELARQRCHGLPVELQLCDYRDFHGQFDHVVSLGMMEHVGYHNYRTYARMLHRCLRPGGFALIQVIGSPVEMKATDPWINRYIFPNSMLPSVRQIGWAIDSIFHVEDWHSFGGHYDKTLMCWLENFDAAWNDLRPRYDERFRRMWRYYLMLCAGIFRSKRAQLWQIVLSKGGVPGVYQAVR